MEINGKLCWYANYMTGTGPIVHVETPYCVAQFVENELRIHIDATIRL